MKKILIFIAVSALAFTMSCKDESLNPYPETIEGAFIIFSEIKIPAFNLNDLANAEFVATLSDPGGVTTSYEVSVSLFKGGVSTDTFAIKTVSSFPSDLVITAAEASALVGIELDSLEGGDRFDFIATSTGPNNQKVIAYGDDNNIGSDLFGNSGQKQAYIWSTFVACPSELAGTMTYEVLASNASAAAVGRTGDFTMEVSSSAFFRYTWTTFTFGIYNDLYGCCERVRGPSTILEMTDICDGLSMSSADTFGCAWEILDVYDINGPEMTMDVFGSCLGVYTVKFTRTDGTDWPAGLTVN